MPARSSMTGASTTTTSDLTDHSVDSHLPASPVRSPNMLELPHSRWLESRGTVTIKGHSTQWPCFCNRERKCPNQTTHPVLSTMKTNTKYIDLTVIFDVSNAIKDIQMEIDNIKIIMTQYRNGLLSEIHLFMRGSKRSHPPITRKINTAIGTLLFGARSGRSMGTGGAHMRIQNARNSCTLYL